MLERYTLQKMTLEWLNWNAQFFDYSEEPYLFYLSEILANDFTKNQANLPFDAQSSQFSENVEMKNFMKTFRNTSTSTTSKALDIYSPFRFLNNFATGNLEDYQLSPGLKKNLETQLNQFHLNRLVNNNSQNSQIDFLTSKLGEENFMSGLANPNQNRLDAQKALTQRKLRKDYSKDFGTNSKQSFGQLSNYLDMNADQNTMELRDYYRKQTERSLQDEESKKVFMIINSFGGSVGNGITVHDALQFIKAGSLTLALGVAASAAS